MTRPDIIFIMSDDHASRATSTHGELFKAMLEKLDAKQADIGDVPEHGSAAA
ncbi:MULTISPECIES: hypothetical protein [unclassified Martelella]|uniref:hypothetical protein n=1 Tax=unclassified Martelella TaxID=2629616 RepID=UPI0025BD7DA2|nr:hypothetical protein [Martelella sp.]|tara:strand:- start:26 stop:181 length:156 start_codon:yes stop_codon:yes gene_type:complete